MLLYHVLFLRKNQTILPMSVEGLLCDRACLPSQAYRLENSIISGLQILRERRDTLEMGICIRGKCGSVQELTIPVGTPCLSVCPSLPFILYLYYSIPVSAFPPTPCPPFQVLFLGIEGVYWGLLFPLTSSSAYQYWWLPYWLRSNESFVNH